MKRLYPHLPPKTQLYLGHIINYSDIKKFLEQRLKNKSVEPDASDDSEDEIETDEIETLQRDSNIFYQVYDAIRDLSSNFSGIVTDLYFLIQGIVAEESSKEEIDKYLFDVLSSVDDEFQFKIESLLSAKRKCELILKSHKIDKSAFPIFDGIEFFLNLYHEILNCENEIEFGELFGELEKFASDVDSYAKFKNQKKYNKLVNRLANVEQEINEYMKYYTTLSTVRASYEAYRKIDISNTFKSAYFQSDASAALDSIAYFTNDLKILNKQHGKILWKLVKELFEIRIDVDESFKKHAIEYVFPSLASNQEVKAKFIRSWKDSMGSKVEHIVGAINDINYMLACNFTDWIIRETSAL